MSVQTGVCVWEGGGGVGISFPPKTLSCSCFFFFFFFFFFFHRVTVDGSTVLFIILVRFTIEQFHFFIYIRFH